MKRAGITPACAAEGRGDEAAGSEGAGILGTISTTGGRNGGSRSWGESTLYVA